MVRSPNPSTRSPQNYNLGSVPESVHEMDGLSPNFGPLSTWTGGQMDGPQTAVFVRGGLFCSATIHSMFSIDTADNNDAIKPNGDKVEFSFSTMVYR